MFLLKFFPIMLGWSSHGHAQLTALGLGVALGKLLGCGKTYFFKQAAKHYFRLFSYGEASEGIGVADGIDQGLGKYMTQTYGESRDPTLTDADVDGTNARAAMEAAMPFCQNPNVNVATLFDDLPALVVYEDVHLGNIPGKGERFEPGHSQVRHFMRSNEGITSQSAFFASRSYILSHLVAAWRAFRAALWEPRGFWENAADFFGSSQGSRGLLFRDGKKQLAAALHTLEDSYAPGHVQRSGAEIIEKVHIWDAENQNADPATGWDGHHDYDNPDNPTSRPHYLAAQSAIGDCIFVILANLDEDEAVALRAIENCMDSKLIAVCKE